MLLIENSNVLIDVERVPPLEHNGESLEWENWYSQLVFYVSIQVNGKLKRTFFSTRVEKLAKNEIIGMWVNGYYIWDRDTIYNPFRMLYQLWYDVPTDMELHEPVRQALEEFYWEQA